MSKDTSNLINAKKQKNDEYYTQYEDIQREINHYEKHFKNKVVFCNCDDPFESNFFKFFIKNFNYLGLKRLICTCFRGSPVAFTIFDYLKDDCDEPLDRWNGYVIDIKSVPMKNGRGVSDEDIDNLLNSKNRGVKKLEGDGDFRSKEVIEYLKQADIVVTNPPFSLFREYVAQLVEYKKKFLIIGNKNNITYKDLFQLIKDNKIWLGYGFNGGNAFFKSVNRKNFAEGVYNEETGLVKFRNCCWFTNIDIEKRHEKIVMTEKYSKEKYQKYDNCNAINVDKVKNIPRDYKGVMGVPVTFMDVYSPEQFEIVGLDDTKNEWRGRGPDLNGKTIYRRILIKRKDL